MMPPHLDPITLSRRSTWLTCALVGVGTGSLEEDTKNVADVANFSEEAPFLAEHAHLACYWLLHHYIAGNTDMLDAAIAQSRGSSHPWVAQVRELVEQADQSPLRIGAITSDYLERFAQNAPDKAFSGATLDNKSTAESPVRVEHEKFGEGFVVDLLGSGDNAKAVVEFDTFGRKTLLQRFLQGLPRNKGA